MGIDIRLNKIIEKKQTTEITLYNPILQMTSLIA